MPGRDRIQSIFIPKRNPLGGFQKQLDAIESATNQEINFDIPKYLGEGMYSIAIRAERIKYTKPRQTTVIAIKLARGLEFNGVGEQIDLNYEWRWYNTIRNSWLAEGNDAESAPFREVMGELNFVDQVNGTLCHPNKADFTFLSMEYCERSALDCCNERQWPAAPLDMLTQLIDGLDFLHRNGIYHRSISLTSIFMRDCGEGQARLIFGNLAHCQVDPNSTMCESNLLYWGPEVNRTILHSGNPEDLIPYDNIKLDIFALGVVFFAMIHNILPWLDGNGRDQFLENRVWQHIGLNSFFSELLGAMLNQNPDLRERTQALKIRLATTSDPNNGRVTWLRTTSGANNGRDIWRRTGQPTYGFDAEVIGENI